jgi:hypothetical protein
MAAEKAPRALRRAAWKKARKEAKQAARDLGAPKITKITWLMVTRKLGQASKFDVENYLKKD